MESAFKDSDSEELPLIMVLEGSADEMCLISDLLAQKDFRVLGYSDCEKAYELLGRETPVLSIIDINQTGTGGIDLIRKIRNEDKAAAMPIIAIIASESEKDLAGGAEAFLIRPFDATSLNKTVECLLKETL